MPTSLTPAQFELLARAAEAPMAASTLRTHSELRWLEHLGLVELDRDGRFAITATGEARLTGVAADSQIDA